MLAALRFVGLINVAVWLGAGVFFMFGVAPAVFSAEMKAIFPEYYVGTVAQILIARYFKFSFACGVIALAHYVLETVWMRRPFRKSALATILVPLALVTAATFVVQPRMRTLFQMRHRAPTEEQRADAKRQFGILHGAAQVMNVVSLFCIAGCAWRIGNPPETPRFVGAPKFRG